MANIHLIPAPLFEYETKDIPSFVQKRAISIKKYFVENVRTARRVLKAFDKSVDIDQIQFEIIEKSGSFNTTQLEKWIKDKEEIGIMSEAGMPVMADPGTKIVSHAHRLKATILPYSGPSSLLLALVGSGLNGQKFAFKGYLPIEQEKKRKSLKHLEHLVLHEGSTQIFIETPYRNNQLLESLLRNLHPEIKLCIAYNLTAQDQYIRTLSIHEWVKSPPNLHKKPTIFLIGQ